MNFKTSRKLAQKPHKNLSSKPHLQNKKRKLDEIDKYYGSKSTESSINFNSLAPNTDRGMKTTLDNDLKLQKRSKILKIES